MILIELLKLRICKENVVKFLKIFSLFFIILSFPFCTHDSADNRIVLKVSHNGPETHPFQRGFEGFKELLEAETGGKVEVQIFPNAQLGSEEESTQMVELGLIASAASSTAGGLSTSVPEAEIFNLPFIFRDLDHCYAVLDGPTGEWLAGIIEEKLDCLVLGYWFSGIRNVWNGKKPVLTPDDLNGMKIRVMSSPILIETFNAMGAQPTPMAFGELYSALQMGVVDGAETDHIDLLYEKFHEVTEYVSMTNHMFLVIALIFSKKVYDDLPPDIQAAVLKAGKASVMVEREEMAIQTKSALDQLKELGLKFYEVDKSLFRNKVESVYRNNADKVGGMERINEILNKK